MDFKKLVGNLKNPKYLPFILIAVGLGVVTLIKNKTDDSNTEGFAEEIQPSNTSNYGILDEMENLGLNLGMIVDESFQTMTETITEQNEQSTLGITEALENLSTAVESIPASTTTTIVEKPKETTNSTPKPTKKTTTKKPQYFTVEKYTGKNPYEGTLGGIAIKFKTTISNLMKLNPSIKDPNKINAGQKLRVS